MLECGQTAGPVSVLSLPASLFPLSDGIGSTVFHCKVVNPLILLWFHMKFYPTNIVIAKAQCGFQLYDGQLFVIMFSYKSF